MNERIKELLEQTGGFVDINQFLGGEKGCVIYTYEGLEKFAELIVKECVDYCGENLSKTVGAALKIHFGVKE